MSLDPKICIAFNSGAAGDFFTVLLHQQYDEAYVPNISDIGCVGQEDAKTLPGHPFKAACQDFYDSNFDAQVFDGITDGPVVNTHYCYPEVMNLFPDCEFYYIDDGEYLDVTTNFYIKKRLAGETLLPWLARGILRRANINRMLPLSDEQVRKFMIRDWGRNLELWKSLGITRIDFSDIIDKEKCRKLVKSIVKLNFNEDVFNRMYDFWASKNTELICSVKQCND